MSLHTFLAADRVGRCVAAAVLVLLASCGGKDPSQVSDWPMADTACSELGKQECAPSDGDRWLVLRCSLDGQGKLWWKVSLECAFGCKDGKCLTQDGDVADVEYPDMVPVSPDADVAGPGEVGETDEGSGDNQGPDICIPDCNGKTCGPDGCGGSCGDCPKDFVCIEDSGKCCMPECKGKLCGDDGCGGECGTCPEGHECGKYNQCVPVCAPDCEGRECGPDGCEGSCGDCPPGKGCGPEGKCTLCVPLCDNKECGDDGCGGSCGGCQFGYQCKDFQCTEPCNPSCAGKKCGDDGCGGSCGKCLPGEKCLDGQCKIVCEPACAGKECGPDGCGGSCGKCPPWAWCSPQGLCVSDCTAPDCEGKECGPDGCGGSCGSCPAGKYCVEKGSCAGPGGDCMGIGPAGWCDGNNLLTCSAGKLLVTNCKSMGKNVVCEWLDATQAYGCNPHGECVPDCANKVCGDDGCGGSCGKCQPGQTCDSNGLCIGQGPCGDVTYHGCCSGTSVLWCDGGVLWYMDCSTLIDPGKQKCGWNEDFGFYDCVAEETKGPEQYPYYCEGPCVPSCSGKQCGDDGCGGTCGICPAGTECKGNVCEGQQGGCGGYSEKPACQGDTVVWCEGGKVYFQDCKGLGQYWQCGWVPNLFVYGCYETPCVPDCDEKECGDDGCGYVCGYCPSTMMCNDKFQCVYGQGFCGDIDYIGKCDGNVVKWCQNGVLQEFPCANLGPTWQCGWYGEGGYYWCLKN